MDQLGVRLDYESTNSASLLPTMAQLHVVAFPWQLRSACDDASYPILSYPLLLLLLLLAADYYYYYLLISVVLPKSLNIDCLLAWISDLCMGVSRGRNR